ncbi:indolepyruvate oxidoreductase subunit beta [Clostridium cellulovorans]|uniref:Pyruvate/ketoisovalerate oxidoreductase, catalytic domain n=1 Tax=Clostridium cellulovorans (strain ATCC 35296 / DSM 3052 / OCM 3 / 743B) TaxID=573061 RepID=D9SMI8_CLOC7|nr:indolepyruvate oxidoreductase subunit beta [Clostridium cellulovorans]ADL53844.1 Pyruvate/ketoisovalerate oxidoreductase, catalytic domain [Clostridium cellulovorans 743B]
MNILISAVGGQGALLASRILGKLAQNVGLDVKISEVHGMSQRGGSVVTHVKFGDKIFSPVIESGTADVILSFELLECANYIHYLKKEGTLIVNTQKIEPMPVITGATLYPSNLISEISKLPVNLYTVDAVGLASRAGNVKAVNLVLVGILASITDIEKSEWKKVIEETSPLKFLEINLKAFDFGYNYKDSYQSENSYIYG